MQLTAAYDVIQKKLGDITVKRLTQIGAELKNVTVHYNNSIKVAKDYELKFAAVTRDCNDIVRGLKLANDRGTGFRGCGCGLRMGRREGSESLSTRR